MTTHNTIFSLLGPLVAISALTATAAPAQQRGQVPEYRVFGEPTSATDAEAIDALMEEFKESWSAQETKRLLQTHAEDIEWINAYARIFRGTKALQVFLDERLFPAFDAAVSRGEAGNMKRISRRYLGDDAAVVHWYTDGRRGESRNAGEDARRTHLHFVLDKRADGWKIAHLAIFDARE